MFYYFYWMILPNMYKDVVEGCSQRCLSLVQLKRFYCTDNVNRNELYLRCNRERMTCTLACSLFPSLVSVSYI